MAHIARNRFVNGAVSELRDANYSPIYGYQHLPVVTLEKVVETVVPFVPGLANYVAKAKENCHRNSTNLTHDESAAIYLYTMPIAFFSNLNDALLVKIGKPWFAFLELFLNALEKLPSMEMTLWRGVFGNVTAAFLNDGEEILWSINSCSKSPEIVGRYICETGTVFVINPLQGKDISAYSAIDEEQGVILMSGTRLLYRLSTDESRRLSNYCSFARRNQT